MRVLVTGHAGRVGRAATAALLARHHEVTGFDLCPAEAKSDALREVIGTFTDREKAASAVQGADVVLHLGALMSWRPQDHDAMFSANVEGTRCLIEAATAAGVHRFVFASSGEVYPENAPQFLPITEDHPTAPNSAYGLTKMIGEEIVRFFGRTGALEVVVLRFSHTQDAAELLDEGSTFSGPRFFYHPRLRQQEAFENAQNVALLRANDPGRPSLILARNENGRPYAMHITDTRDMVAGLLLTLDHPDAVGETYNLGATDPVDFSELLPKMAALTGLPLTVVDFAGPGVHYRTSNDRIRERLGFKPVWTIDKMLEESASARRMRAAG